MTDTPAAAGTPRTDAILADIQSRYLSSAGTRMHEFAAFARTLERELAAANERIRSFDQTDSASCVGTGCKASSLAAELSACRAELALEKECLADCHRVKQIYAGDLVKWEEECKELRAAKEQSERLLAAAKDAARLAEEWERECSDADQILLTLGLNPNSFRSEGGSLMLSKIVTALAGKESPK